MIGEIVGNYRITAKLGAGGMGEVFLAEDTRLERQAAIKFLPADKAADPQRRQRFFTEARAASALNHPNVCTVYDVGETANGVPYIAMEYVEGSELGALVKLQPLEVSRTIAIAIQVADALETAHARSIVHRDIKPANICLTNRGQVKVLDFGLAKRLTGAGAVDGELTADMAQTQDGQVLGTPSYMSPEQALGRTVDHRCDLFSLGGVIYTLLTGRPPFRGANVGEVIDNVIHRMPEAIARFNYHVPTELERITLKLLTKDVDRRYQSARDLLVDLRNLQRMTESTENAGRGDAVTADVPRVRSSTSPDPKEIARSDVVITYADLDDQPLPDERPGWISRFHENLQVRIAQLSGRQVAVVKQPDLADSAEIEAELLKELPHAKTVISVLSPPFARSGGCRRIVEAFWKSATESGQFEVDQRSRLLNVVKTPVDVDDLPTAIRPLYAELAPYEFFERDPESGRLRVFDETFGDTATRRFHERVYDVAYDIAQVLKYLGDATGRDTAHNPDRKTVFLAATTSDLEPQRDQLRRELVELGHEVLPRQPLPLIASEIVTVVNSCLERADVAIHFVGENFGLVPEATELSIVALQNQVAARFCGTKPLQRLIWIPKGLKPRDERQSSFLRQLESEPSTLAGAELVADTLENLKVLLRSRWDRERVAREKPPATSPPGGAPRVYLICDRADEEAIEPLEDFFFSRGIEVSLPGFEADESEVQEIHIRNLRDCDAALIYYGAAGMHWVDFKIRDLQKAAGYRDSQPIAASAVYLAPPSNRRKERFKTLSATVIRQSEETFDPEVLNEFVASVLNARGEVP